MHHASFLQDLAVVLAVAGIVTLLFNRLKQPVVLGYIIAGFLIGPHTPPFPLVHTEATIHTLSELGVIFLMFALGLEFSLKKLRAVGLPAVGAALLEIVVMVGAGYGIGKAFGWREMDALFLGGILAISSTTIIIKALREMKATREPYAQLIFGILVVEDLLGILIIALLSGLATTGSLSVGSAFDTMWRLGVFLAALFVAGILIVPRLLSYVGKFRNAEMMLVTALALCFGVSLLAYKFEYSVALGAFLIGAIIAETKEARQIEGLTESLRDLFGAVFFVSVGMLINPRILAEHWLVIVVITATVLVGKVVACALGAFASGTDRKTSLQVGMGLAQIGEFSFIIASLGIAKGVTSDFLYPIAVTVSALTTLTTPYLLRASVPIHGFVERVAPARVIALSDAYGRALTHASRRLPRFVADNYVQRGVVQFLLNALLISGVFFVVSESPRLLPADFQESSFWQTWGDTCLWACAVILSLPLQVATVRRILRTARYIADAAHGEGGSGETSTLGSASTASPMGAQNRLGHAVMPVFLCVLGLALFLLLNLGLSVAFLPPLKILLAIGAILGTVGIVFRRHAVKVYKNLQERFEATLAAEHPHGTGASHLDTVAPQGAVIPLPGPAALTTLTLEDAPHIAGRFIKDTELRKVTGASIVAIERDGGSLVNPLPDEILYEGDVLHLFGRPEQLEAARVWLKGSA
ncbi:MAG: cation:proton antiporter [Silvanigrellales bacterium]|nr:cation:proton antiporter [Silvanigrellales bacterium]